MPYTILASIATGPEALPAFIIGVLVGIGIGADFARRRVR